MKELLEKKQDSSRSLLKIGLSMNMLTNKSIAFEALQNAAVDEAKAVASLEQQCCGDSTPCGTGSTPQCASNRLMPSSEPA